MWTIFNIHYDFQYHTIQPFKTFVLQINNPNSILKKKNHNKNNNTLWYISLSTYLLITWFVSLATHSFPWKGSDCLCHVLGLSHFLFLSLFDMSIFYSMPSQSSNFQVILFEILVIVVYLHIHFGVHQRGNTSSKWFLSQKKECHTHSCAHIL